MRSPEKSARRAQEDVRRAPRKDGSSHAVRGQVPAARGIAASAARHFLLRVFPLHFRELEADVFTEDVAFFHVRRNGADQYILDFDFKVLDALALAVGAHEFEARLGNGLAGRAGLQQHRRGQVGQLGDDDVLVLASCGRVAAARRGGGGLRLFDAPADRFALDPVLVLVIGGLSLDAVYLQIYIDCHGVLLWLKDDRMDQELVDFGNSATSRSDTDNSSSWKCGRRNDTARYTPGRPDTSCTCTDASRRGNCAFCSWLALSSSSTYCISQRFRKSSTLEAAAKLPILSRIMAFM